MLNYVLMEEQLRGEYKSVFSHIYSDVITRNYQEDFLDDKMSDLFDLLVTAQSQNLPAERVTGSDPERFCREFFADYGLRERLRSVADRLKSVAWFLLVFELPSVSARIHALRDIFTVRTNIAPYGVGTAVGILLMLVSAFIRPAIWKSRRMSAGKWSGIICLVMVALIIAGTALFKDRELLVPAFPFILGSAAYLLVYYTVRSVCNYRRFGTLRNPHPKITGIAKMMLSKRSRMPPWPGRILLESLMPMVRLSCDSVRSPSVPKTTVSSATIIHCKVSSTGKNRARSSDAPTAASAPPMKPSHVFLGEMRSNILCRPIVTPKQ